MDGECLAGWASINSLALLYKPKDSASFHFGHWNSGTNPGLAFASADSDSRLPYRPVLEKFPKLQHRPLLITPYHAKTVTAAFHLHNREAQPELKVYANGKLLPFCPVPTYLGVKLDRSLTFRHHFETLCKKLVTRVTLLRRLAGSALGAGAKTLRTAALSLVYSTAEYCAPVRCCSAHTCLIDSVLNDALRIVAECLRPTPTDYLPILLSIQPAELRRLGATLSLTKRGTPNPHHILHGELARLPDVPRERLNSRRPLVPATRKQLNDLSKLGIRAARWTNDRWSAEYSKRTSVLHVFIPHGQF